MTMKQCLYNLFVFATCPSHVQSALAFEFTPILHVTSSIIKHGCACPVDSNFACGPFVRSFLAPVPGAVRDLGVSCGVLFVLLLCVKYGVQLLNIVKQR